MESIAVIKFMKEILLTKKGDGNPGVIIPRKHIGYNYTKYLQKQEKMITMDFAAHTFTAHTFNLCSYIYEF